MRYVLGLDLGTSYFKAGLFDREGRLCGLGRRTTAPRVEGLRVEWPADWFWDRIRGALSEALDSAGAQPEEIAAASYASQANTFLLLDQEGQPLTPLVAWSDRRVQAVPDNLRALWESPEALRDTGKALSSPALAVCKALWFREHEPATWQRAHCFMSISEFLLYGMTGHAVSDAGTASLLGLLELPAIRWWPPVLAALGWDASFLGRPMLPGCMAGRVHERGKNRLGLPTGIPVIAGTLDHYAAALGAGIGRTADGSVSLGTVLALVEAADHYRPEPACVTGAGVAAGPRYFRMVFDGHGAGVLERYRNTRAPNHSFAQLSDEAARTPAGAGGLLADPGAEEPPGFSGPDEERHGHGPRVRAIMESTAATLRTLRARLSLPPDAPLLAAGGGAQSDLWLRILAAVCDIPVLQSDCPEPACRGAALLAAAGAGWFPSSAAAARAWIPPPKRFPPDPEERAFYKTWLVDRQRRLAAGAR